MMHSLRRTRKLTLKPQLLLTGLLVLVATVTAVAPFQAATAAGDPVNPRLVTNCVSAKQACERALDEAAKATFLDQDVGRISQEVILQADVCTTSAVCKTLGVYEPVPTVRPKAAEQICSDHVTLCALSQAGVELASRRQSPDRVQSYVKGRSLDAVTGIFAYGLYAAGQALGDTDVSGYMWREADGKRDIFVPPGIALALTNNVTGLCVPVQPCEDAGVLPAGTFERLRDGLPALTELITISKAEFAQRPEIAALQRAANAGGQAGGNK